MVDRGSLDAERMWMPLSASWRRSASFSFGGSFLMVFMSW